MGRCSDVKKNSQRGRNRDEAATSAASRRWGPMLIWVAAGVMLALGLQAAFRAKKSSPLTSPVASGVPTFSRDIAPIIFQNCTTCHHPGDAAPFSLLNYADAKKRARQIAEVTRRRLMPPWLPEKGYNEFVGQRYLADEQVALIQKWYEQGAPEGNSAETPALPPLRDGWQIGKPDLVIQLPEAYALAGDGPDVYRNFVIPVPGETRRYVRAVELNPGNAKAVHHAFMLVDTTGDSRRRDELDPEIGFPGLHAPPSAQTPTGHFMSWQPGKLATTDSEDLSWALEPGTDFILQMHLRPTGRPEKIQPSVAFYFTSQPPTKAPFKFGLWTHDINVPPGVSNHVVTESYTLPVEVDVLRVLPHTHYVGRRVRAWATLPDGRQQWLINIPNWDFNWQGDYTYVKPVTLPKGAAIFMSYVFDNTTNNPVNPNSPPKRVQYGVNSSDEMAELWLQVLPHNPEDVALLEKDYQPRVFRSTISYNSYLLKTDPNNAKAHSEIGKAHLFLFNAPEAERYLRRAIELKPGEDEPHYYLGLLWRMTGRLVEAKQEFQAAILANPNNHKAHGNLGLILLDESNLSEAELHFQSALRISRDDNIARDGLKTVARRRADALVP